MKGAFRAASRRQQSKSPPFVIGVNVKKRNSRLTGATRSLSTTRKMKGPNSRQPCPRLARAYQPEGYFRHQSLETIESTPKYKDWTPMCGNRTPEGQGHRTRHPRRGQGLCKTKDFVESRTSWDAGLCGIRDFVGFKTSRDPGLRGIQDFAGHGTSWDLGLRRKQELHTPWTRILFCGVL